MKKSIFLPLLLVFLLFLTGCTPEPVSEAVAREELANYLASLVETGLMTAVGDLLEYEIGEEVIRDTTKELDTLYFTVTTVEMGGLNKGHLYMAYFEPLVQEVATYQLTYRLNDKDWQLVDVEKVEVISCRPLEGIREKAFLEELEFEEKMKASLVSQDLDLDQGLSVITLDTEKSYLLYTEAGQMEYAFEFDESRKVWENTRAEKIGPWDYTYTFHGNNKWLYQAKPDENGGKAYVGLQLNYDREENRLTVTYVGGYKDKYDRIIGRTDQYTWSGRPSPTDPLVFVSEDDPKQLKIVDQGTAINFDGYTFYKI
ncbi:MAG: hypothetical protein WBI83_01825 [bacterium]